MLSEKQLNDLLEIFLERAQSVNEEYLIRMGEQIQEIGELIPSSVNRLVQLKRMNANLDAVKKEIARIAEISMQDLEKIFEKAMETDARFVAKTFGNEYKPSILDNEVLQQILTAQLNVTLEEMANLSRTRISSEAYRKAIDKGIQAVQSGMEDYRTATRRALSEAAEAGIRVEIGHTGAYEQRVGYGGRYTKRLDSAVRQNVLDGIRSLSNDVLEQLGEEFGADGVELSAHALCAEDHIPYQGRQYSNEQFRVIQEEKLDRPFGMWNCRHSIYPIKLGVSTPAYTEEELAAFQRNSTEKVEIDGVSKTRYQWTQEQRRIETAVRRQKDVAIAAKAAGNAPLRRDAQRNIDALQKRYSLISEKAGISKQMERMRVEGYTAMSKRELKNAGDTDIIKINEVRDLIRSEATNKTLNTGNQNKHIKDSGHYIAGRSYVNGSIQQMQEIIDQYHGTGTPQFSRKGDWNGREVIELEYDFGVCVDLKTGMEIPTNRGTIHYGKKGAHIVPARKEPPNET